MRHIYDNAPKCAGGAGGSLTSTLPEQRERQVITGKGSEVLRDQPSPSVDILQ